MTSTSSTTQPYASATTSSTPNQAQQVIPQYVVPIQQPQATNADSGFNSDWMIMAVGMLLTGIIGYFSSIMAVKSDIATNRQEISIVTKEVSHVQSDLNKVENDVKQVETDLKQVNELEKNTAILSLRVNNLEKNISKK